MISNSYVPGISNEVLYVQKLPIVPRVVKNSSVQKHTEWSDATPAVGDMSFGSEVLVMGVCNVKFTVAVLSVLSSLLLLLSLGDPVVGSVASGSGLETGNDGPS